MKLKSLKSKWMLAVFTLVIGSGLMISLLVTQRYSRVLFETMAAQAENLAHTVALESADKILTQDMLALQKMLKLQENNNPDISYIFISRKERILAHTFAKGVPAELLTANEMTSGSSVRFQRIVSAGGEHYLDVAWPIFEKKAGFLRLGLSEKPYRRKLIALWLQIAGLTGGILLLAVAGCLFFVGRITRPLETLAGATHKIVEGDLSVRVPEQGQDEVGELAASFNHMTGRMEEYTRKLEEQTRELERAHHQTRTFCRIVQQIGSLRSIEEIGSFLLQRFQNILKCDRMALLIFSADRKRIFVLTTDGVRTLEKPEVLRTAEAALEGLKNVTFSDKVKFTPPLVPQDFQAAARRAMVSIRHNNQVLGGLYVACPGDCQCSVKEFEMVDLILTQSTGVILRAIAQEVEMRDLRSRVINRAEFNGIIGKDSKMQEIYRLINDIASTDVTVLILGENGTGKEMVAHAIHNQSPRKDKPFVVINCSAYPPTMLESELFGHEKGAFTGAIRRKPGRFEQADGGTVFLDEIGEIPPSAQIKLLRVLQTRQIERLGGEKTLDVDVRILAATNKDLNREVKNDRFREDLFYRINVIPIYLPPLRQRHTDISLLIRHFLYHFTQEQDKEIEDLSPEALRILLDYPWPGNVRELKNSIEHATVMAKGRKIEVSDLPAVLRHNVGFTIRGGGLLPALEEYERKMIQQALEGYGWNKKLTARRLGIGRNTLYLKLKKYQITNPATHQPEFLMKK